MSTMPVTSIAMLPLSLYNKKKNLDVKYSPNFKTQFGISWRHINIRAGKSSLGSKILQILRIL